MPKHRLSRIPGLPSPLRSRSTFPYIPMATLDISKLLGSTLMGALFASLLSGVVWVQVVIYFKMYPEDNHQQKGLVAIVWFLDTLHTVFMWSALWSTFIDNYGDPGQIEIMPWTAVMTVMLTVIVTLLVHLFFAHRIFMLSKRKYWLTLPIVALITIKTLASVVNVVYLFKLPNLVEYRKKIGWDFTLGQSLSTLIDIVLCVSLFILLQKSRTGAATLNTIIDSLIWYSFQTGSLTCAGTCATFICWLVFPNYPIFMGIYFSVCKLYSSSLLVTLNVRGHIRMNSYYKNNVLQVDNQQIDDSDPLSVKPFDVTIKSKSFPSKSQPVPVAVNVERNVQFDTS